MRFISAIMRSAALQLSLLAAACLLSASAYAAPTLIPGTAGDEGRAAPLLLPPLDDDAVLELPAPAAPGVTNREPPGYKVEARGFSFRGNSVFPEAELQALVSANLNQVLSFADLEAIVARVTRHYRDNGYPLAFAYVPNLFILYGIVDISIVEGRYAAIRITGTTRLRESAIRARLSAVRTGDLIHTGTLEQALLLLSDLPGIKVKSSFENGQLALGTADLLVTVEDTRRITGGVDFDNFGSRFSGKERLGATVNINNPSGAGDLLSLRAITSGAEFNLGRITYARPVGNSGSQLGGSFTHLDYELGEELSVFDATGQADLVSLVAVHPFVRSSTFNFHGQFGFEYKNYHQSVFDGVLTSDDRLRILSLVLSGNHRDGTVTGTTWSVNFQQGLGDVLGGLKAGFDADSSRFGAGGSFTKLILNASHQRQLARDLKLSLRASAQLSSSRLVSAEQFYPGGIATVRAYSEAEGLGDEGYAGSAELAWQPRDWKQPFFRGQTLGDVLQFTAFYDIGASSVKDALFFEDESRQLSGAGLGINLVWPRVLTLGASYAWRLTGDSLLDPDDQGRFLFQISKSF